MGKVLSGELSCPCDRSCFCNRRISRLTLKINPIAHRMAKTPQSFGHSECSRVTVPDRNSTCSNFSYCITLSSSGFRILAILEVKARSAKIFPPIFDFLYIYICRALKKINIRKTSS